MKIGELTAELGEIRLDDMKGFDGIFVKKEILWKLMFSYLVNANQKDDVPDWLMGFYSELKDPRKGLPTFAGELTGSWDETTNKK